MTTPVIFRKWPESEGGDVIALFPTELGSNDPYDCSSYEHVGQHGAADPAGLIQRTKAAKPAEYADLKAELKSLGYDDLQVIQRYRQEFLEARRLQLAGLTGADRGTREVLQKRQQRWSGKAKRKTKSPVSGLAGIR